MEGKLGPYTTITIGIGAADITKLKLNGYYTIAVLSRYQFLLEPDSNCYT